jgi:RNA polymerase sigma-70 factor (ECF subfamily)
MMMKQDETMTPLTLATLQREAQHGSRRLARRLNLCREAEADICQDLLVDLLARLHRFDPDRGSLGAFAGRIVANQACCIARQILRDRRVMACSLDQDDSCRVQRDQIPEEQGFTALFGQLADAGRAMELNLDIARCGTRLTEAETALCGWLAEHPVTELVRMGIGSRSGLYRRIAELRALFTASGLASA